ncbi:MAG: DUF2922 domain-containing protein [Selenomonas sp.]|nr:DUF2922 domain-containing protein [Selenomonas sp.]
MKTLKMVFTLEAGGNLTYSLNDPKEGLTQAEVKTVMQKMLDKGAVVSGEDVATAIKDAYIYDASRIELA